MLVALCRNVFLDDGRVPAIMLEINRRLYLKPAVREAYRNGNAPLPVGSTGVLFSFTFLLPNCIKPCSCHFVTFCYRFKGG
jgi:hypothetical protein